MRSYSAGGASPALSDRTGIQCRARCSHALGPVATAGRPVASVENTTSPSCGTDRIASLGQLCNTADSGRGPWYIARSKALSLGLSNAYFRSLGLPSLFGAC